MALGFFRRHRQWLYAFLWIVILAFVVLYVPAFQGDQEGSPGETLGRVGTLTITVNEYQKLYAERRQMYERIYQGRGIDSNMLREMGLPDQVFQELVQSRLLDLEAHRLGLAVDDAALAAAIARMPQFQREGQFVGGEEVRRRLALQGLSIEDFEASVRRNLLHEKLQGVVTDGISVADDEAERTYRERNEQAKIEYVLVDAARFRAQASASDDEVKTWFAAHPESYRIPEKRVLAYVAIDREALKSQVAVTDYDIKTYYKENEERFREEEQVCASHILIKTQSDPKAAVGHPEAEAKKLAEALLAKVKGGADFAALAKQSSEDEGSKVKGGSLDCFTRERMVPEFSEVAFNLKAGETSELVKSPYGYHIIRVTEHRDEVVQPLPQVRERIQDTLLATKANERAEEKAEAIARTLARGRSLEEAAAAEGLTVQRAPAFARAEPPEALRSPMIAARAFELKQGEIAQEPFSLPRGIGFIALQEIQPARLPELKDVQERVKQDVIEDRALGQAKSLAAELKVRAESVGLDKAAAALQLTRKETPSLVARRSAMGELGTGLPLDEAVFAQGEKTLSDPVRVEGGYALLRVIERKAFDAAAFEKEKETFSNSLREEKKRRLFGAYLAQLRRRYPVVRTDAWKRVVS